MTLALLFLMISATSLLVDAKKNGRAFPIFNIVQFDNEQCQGTTRLGTCFTASECNNFGGSASGSCASGFGVCCIFSVSAGGSTVSRNCSYIENPASLTTTFDPLEYTIKKVDNSICDIRLDFETFQIQGPADESQNCPDTLMITTNTAQQIPTICGQNMGEHMYIDVGTEATDEVKLNFAFQNAAATRSYSIKVNQIPCNSDYSPDNRCLQWYTAKSGTIRSFNYEGNQHLPDQNYEICIRPAAGSCCIEYLPCASMNGEETFQLTLPIGAGMPGANIGNMCTSDLLRIDTLQQCDSGNAGATIDRVCGNRFNIAGEFAGPNSINAPACDCTRPFHINFITDGVAAAMVERGFCLDYQQLPC